MFDAHENKIRDIFAGDYKYIIPRNQRKYVWEEKQWSDLLADVKYAYEMASEASKNVSHFMGSFVLQKKDEYSEIIDGQQRITTLMLAIGALAMRFNIIGNKNEWGKSKQYIQGDIGLESEYIRIENKDVPDIEILLMQTCTYKDYTDVESYFDKSLLHHRNPANKRVYDCMMYFYSAFAEMENNILTRIREILLDIKIVNISSEDEIDCYDIFEILNARGIDLEEGELLKNFIFKYSQPRLKVDAAKTKWDKIEKNIVESKDDFDKFLAIFSTYKYGNPTKKTEGLYHIIRGNTKRTEVNNLLEELLVASEMYLPLNVPELTHSLVVKDCLSFFKMINHRQFRPIFMSLLYAEKLGYLTQKQTEDMFIFLRNFTFAYTVVMGGLSNALNDWVIKTAHNIYLCHDTDSINIAKGEMRKYYPSQEEFKHAFFNLGFSNKNPKYSGTNNRKRMKYIHHEYEKYLQATNELSVNLDSCNMEHIMNDSEEDDITARVGNILLISERINENMGSDDFALKKERMKNSNLISVKKFLERYGESDTYGQEQITKRTEALANLAYTVIWKL